MFFPVGITWGSHRFFSLELLREQAETFGLAILGYCLMTNHVHLIAKLETKLGCRLRPLKRGRPRKETEKDGRRAKNR